MNLSSKEKQDIIFALEIAIESEEQFAFGHMKQVGFYPDETWEPMTGFESTVKSTNATIKRLEKILKKLREKSSGSR